MNLPDGFVDGFGVVHTGSRIMPTDISLSSQNSRQLRFENDGYKTIAQNQSCFVSFRALVLMAAEGKRPLTFVTPKGIEYFTFEMAIADAPKTDAELVNLCEDHLMSLIASEQPA